MVEEYELEHSPLNRKVTRDGVSVDVLIYRGPDDPRWTLEVVDHEAASTVWDDTFETDQKAWEAVMRTIEEEGITCFTEDRPKGLH